MTSPSSHPVIVLLTVNDHETDAVLDAFLDSGAAPPAISKGGITYFDLGIHGGHQIYQSHCVMGAGGLGAAQQRTSEVIAHWSPAAIIAVGIAFGIDENKQNIGDVLVAQQLQDYELGRLNADGTLTPRGDKAQGSAILLNRVKQTDALQRRGNGAWPKVRMGLMLSGQKLIDYLDYRTALKKLHSEAIGGEMEGTGVYVSAQHAKTDWLVVKAICDWGHDKNQAEKDAWQKIAAKNAAVVVKAALEMGCLYEGKNGAATLPLMDYPAVTGNTQLIAQIASRISSEKEPPPDGSVSSSSSQGGNADATGVPSLAWSQEQFDLAVDLLTKSDVGGFLDKLRDEIRHRFNRASCDTPSAIVRWFAEYSVDDIRLFFATIIASLKGVPDKVAGRAAAEEAAAALYMLCADRLVRQAEKDSSLIQGHFVRVPKAANIYYAIIVMGLFGGQVMVRSDESGDPYSEHIYKIHLDPDGSNFPDRFSRAVYGLFFGIEPSAASICEGAGPLPDEQRERLLKALNKDVENELFYRRNVPRVRPALALVIDVDENNENLMDWETSCRNLAETHKVPVFLQDRDIESLLMGMEERTLMDAIEHFWKEIDKRKPSPSKVDSTGLTQNPPPAGATPMPTTTNIHINGNVTNLTNSTGDHSSANSHYGIDSATLMSIIDPLNKAFSSLPEGAVRSQCLDQIAALEAEAKKGKDADKGVIQRAFDTLKSAKDGVEGGEKIIEVLTKAYPFLAPFFGLPLLP